MNLFLKTGTNGGMEPAIGRIIAIPVVAVATIIGIFSSWFITPEGHVDVVKRFGEAKYIANPGLNWKIPLVDTTTTIEIRTRKNSEKMSAATSEQMPVTVVASMNWTVKKSDVLNLFKDYGSLEQFESRVIDPKFRSVVKESVAKYKAEETIGKRDQVTNRVRDEFIASAIKLPIDVSAINIENISLPAAYLKSIETKQTEKNLADAEVFKLQKQNLEAQRAVNIANAEKESAMKRAEGKAYSITVQAKAEASKIEMLGKAEATKIDAITKAMKANPQYVKLVEMQRWNGSYVTTGIGTGSGVLMDLRSK